MDINDQHDQLAGFQPLVDLLFQGAVVIAVVEIVFHDLVVCDELLELLLAAVVVIHALLLAGAGRTGGGGDGLLDLRVRSAQCIDHAVLAGTRCTGYHKQILFVFHFYFCSSSEPLPSACPAARLATVSG